MKLILIIGCMLLTAPFSFAKTTRKPASSIGDLYLVEPMLCSGKVASKPASMQEDYVNITMQFTSFLAKRKDGSFANSLEVKNGYGSNSSVGDEVWYMSPLRKINQTVHHDALSGRNDELDLTIEKTETKGGQTVQTLRGTWAPDGTVVGNYTYNLNCTATLVKKPSRVDDLTRK